MVALAELFGMAALAELFGMVALVELFGSYPEYQTARGLACGQRPGGIELLYWVSRLLRIGSRAR